MNNKDEILRLAKETNRGELFDISEVKRWGSLWGSDDEPLSSLWMSSLSVAMGDVFQDGISVFDYGCGAGRYANFLYQRLNDFTYYGLEREGASLSVVKYLAEKFSSNSRIHFGIFGNALEQEAIASADVVLLGSIFTHLRFRCEDESVHGDSFVTIVSKLLPAIRRGGTVVFSVFIDDFERVCGGASNYGLLNCFKKSYYTLTNIEAYCEAHDLVILEQEPFLAQGVNLHRIFRLEQAVRDN